MRIITNTKACYGCRICELACSFHHRGVFAPDGSSIKVTSDYRTGNVQLEIDSSCDCCRGKAHPLCVRYCLYGALKQGGDDE